MIAAMKPRFAQWLAAKEMTPFMFYKMSGVSHASVLQLAGVRGSRPVNYFTTPLLGRVSQITGIAMEDLLRDAEAARADPTPARKYVRKAAAE